MAKLVNARECGFAKFNENSIKYISVSPALWIVRILRSLPIYFSMADCSAARGSEIILWIAELNFFQSLARSNLFKNVRKYISGLGTTCPSTFPVKSVRYLSALNLSAIFKSLWKIDSFVENSWISGLTTPLRFQTLLRLFCAKKIIN